MRLSASNAVNARSENTSRDPGPVHDFPASHVRTFSRELQVLVFVPGIRALDYGE
jgi:hypothetical protein